MEYRGHFIDNHWVKSGDVKFTSRNPATDTPIWEGSVANAAIVSNAVAAAERAFHAWSILPVDNRIEICLAFQAAVTKNKMKLAARLTEEHGKPLWEAGLEIDALIAKTDISIKAYHERTGQREQPQGTATSTLIHRPHGVVAVFSPFNFPYHLSHGHIIPALIAGNTVILKPSELTPRASEDLVAIWESVGCPPGVLNMVQGDASTGALLCDENIQGLFFTGSVATGRAIHRAFAGRPEVILALELGGNNPLLVFETADTEAAAYQIIQSAFITSGQRCTCARRLILPKNAAGDHVIDALLSTMDKIIIAPGDSDPAPFMGPLISNQAAENVKQFESALCAQGAKKLSVAKKYDGAFLSPSVLDVTNITTPDRECFGPLLQLHRVDSFEAGIKLANQTEFGLAAGLFSDNPDYWKQFHDEMRAGIINWNKPLTGASSSVPFGGIKASGNHRASAYYAADYCAYPVAGLVSPHCENPVERKGFST